MKKFFLSLIVLSIGITGFVHFSPKAEANASTTWTKSASNPVISSTLAAYPRVIKDGSTYKIWVEENGTGLIRYATSSNGVTWSSFQYAKDEFDNNLIAHEPSIIKDGSAYKMWTNMVDYNGYRTSANGINWSAETILTFNTTKAWDTPRITPTVIKVGTTYKMYYNANEGNCKYYIAYAYSTNGTSWTEPQNLGKIASSNGSKSNNLVLKQGTGTQWDGNQSDEALYQTAVIRNSYGTYEMWYGGNKTGWANSYKIGYATSPDGITWTKSSSNPVLSGTASTWDSVGVSYPSVIEDGLKYKMWFTKGNWSGKIGYAVANKLGPIGSITVKNGGSASRSALVPLTLSASGNSGVSHMRFSNDNAHWSTWQTYTTSRSDWNMLSSTYGGTTSEGTKSIYVQFKDRLGHLSPRYKDTIIYDKTAPSGTISIAGGAASTASRYVNLTLSATDSRSGMYMMRFSNDRVHWSPWQNYATSKTNWDLRNTTYGGSASTGSRKVYFHFLDRAGNAGISYDSINYNP